MSVREAVLSRLDDADEPIEHAEVVYLVEYEDGFNMGDVEDAIGDLIDAGDVRDVAPEREGPAYEVRI